MDSPRKYTTLEVRLIVQGALDPYFGRWWKSPAVATRAASAAKSMLVQEDGRILVYGMNHLRELSISRFLPDGGLDPSFGINGTVTSTTNLNIPFTVSLALDQQARIYVASSGIGPLSSWTSIRRFLADGSLDSTFQEVRDPTFGEVFTIGDDGLQFGSGGGVVINIDGNQSSSGPNDFALCPTADGGLIFGRASASVILLQKRRNNGSLDTAFGQNGSVIVYLDSPAVIDSMAVTPDGKILIASSSGQNLVFHRISPNGVVDESFSGHGIFAPYLGTETRVKGIEFLPDGRFVVAGWTGRFEQQDAFLARFLANGQLDASFGGGGIVVSDFGSNAEFFSQLVVRPDGSLFVVGHSTTNGVAKLLVAAYKAGGQVDERFNAVGKQIVDIGLIANESMGIGVTVDDRLLVFANGTTSGSSSFKIARFILGDQTSPPHVTAANSFSVLEGATFVVYPPTLAATHPQSGPAEIGYSLVGLPKHGSILLDGEATYYFTQQQVNDGRVAYRHDGSETLADRITLEIRANNGVWSVGPTLHIAVTPVNEPPWHRQARSIHGSQFGKPYFGCICFV
ncbi:MAG: cadherin-like domain-containing protein [Planctomycetota bacterium]